MKKPSGKPPKGGARKKRAAARAGPPGADATAAEERDALARRRRLEWRAVQLAKERRAARAGRPPVAVMRIIQQVLADECERLHLSARGAAEVCRIGHTTASAVLKGEGRGYVDSMDKIIDGLVDDEAVLLERVLRRVREARRHLR